MIKNIAQNENIPFLDFSNDKRFYLQYELFSDATHLNHNGATLFSELVADSILAMHTRCGGSNAKNDP
jgi:lysophospholipase L1-like esterase